MSARHRGNRHLGRPAAIRLIKICPATSSRSLANTPARLEEATASALLFAKWIAIVSNYGFYLSGHPLVKDAWPMSFRLAGKQYAVPTTATTIREHRRNYEEE